MKENNYFLTEYSKEYLLKESAYYFGYVLDLIIHEDKVRSFASVKKAILDGKPQVCNGVDLFKANHEDKERARIFSKAMHSKSIGAAQAWIKSVSLTQYHCLLDIGGGIGTHTLEACKKWHNLSGVIFEIPTICELAKKNVLEQAMHMQIVVVPGDMWQDDYPEADVHLYSDILHDWAPKQAKFLVEKSFHCLPSRGKIIIHEALFDNDNKTSPDSVVAYNMNMLLWTKGQQFSKQELCSILKRAGFINVTVQSTFGHWSVVTGDKP